jgi:hypothetical protein
MHATCRCRASLSNSSRKIEYCSEVGTGVHAVRDGDPARIVSGRDAAPTGLFRVTFLCC